MFGKVLVPLDGSATSEAVLPWVRELVAAFGTETYLLRVVPPPELPIRIGLEGWSPEPYPLGAPEQRAELAGEAPRYLEGVAAPALAAAQIHLLVREGHAGTEIVAAPKETATRHATDASRPVM